MEVYRGKYNHAGFFKRKKDQTALFRGVWIFHLRQSDRAEISYKAKDSLQLIRYHVCVAKKVELPFK